jgi:hypothetical protein
LAAGEIARIENPAKFLVARQQRIGLVCKKNWARQFNSAEKHRRRDVFSSKSARNEFADNAQESCLAASFFRRSDGKARRPRERIETIGMQDPKSARESIGRRYDNVAPDRGFKLARELRAVYLLRPWLWLLKRQLASLARHGFVSRPRGGNLLVECRYANA